MLNRLFAIISRNYKQILRTKSSALIILLSPFFIMLIAGIAFNTEGVNDVNIGIYSYNDTEMITTLSKSIEENNMDVVLEKNETVCVDNVKNHVTHICLVLSKTSDVQSKITFFVDYSRISIVYTILNSLQDQLTLESKKIGFDITEGLLTTVLTTSQQLDENKYVIESLRSDIFDITYNLNEIIYSIDSANVSFGSGNPEDLAVYSSSNKGILIDAKESIDSDFNKIESKLNDLEKDNDDMNRELKEKYEKIQKLHDSIDDAYQKSGCTSTNNIINTISDFTIGDATYEEQCDYMYSVREAIKEETEVISDAIDTTEKNKEEIRIAKEDIKKSRENMDDNFHLASMNMDKSTESINDISNNIRRSEQEVEAFREDLKNDMIGFSMMISKGSESIDNMSIAFDNIQNSIENVTMLSADGVVNPIISEFKPIIVEKKKIDYIFSAILILIISLTSMLLASIFVMKEKLSVTFFRNIISSTNYSIFIFGNYLSSLFIVLLQSFIIVIVSMYFLNIDILSNIIPLFLLLVLISSVFIFIGLAIGYYFKSEETAILCVIFMNFLMLIFSSLIIPVESISGFKYLVQFNPFLISEEIVKKVVLFDIDVGIMDKGVIILISYVIVFFMISLYLRKKSVKQSYD